MKKLIFILFFLLSTQTALAYIDLNISYSYTKRRVEGVDEQGMTGENLGEAITTRQGAGINIAWYLWEYTALELNYSESTERLVDNRKTVDASSGITINQIDSTVKTQVSGAGIRQAFASRKSRFIPSISIGVAKLVTSGNKKYELDDNGTIINLSYDRDKEVYNSGYGSFQLAIRITQLMRLTLAAKTVVADYKTEDADKNLTYSAGLSWMF